MGKTTGAVKRRIQALSRVLFCFHHFYFSFIIHFLHHCKQTEIVTACASTRQNDSRAAAEAAARVVAHPPYDKPENGAVALNPLLLCIALRSLWGRQIAAKAGADISNIDPVKTRGA